jgi:hypothetical protein
MHGNSVTIAKEREENYDFLYLTFELYKGSLFEAKDNLFDLFRVNLCKKLLFVEKTFREI